MAIKVTYRRTSRLSMRIVKNGDVHVSAPVGMPREGLLQYSCSFLLAVQKIFVSLQQNHYREYMDKASVISNIKAIASKTLPAGSTLLLYGSRARGDNRADSDWDLLILLDKSKLHSQDYDYGYPFREFGWDIGEEINPHIYTKKQWNEWTFLPYHKNVERDKIVLV